MNFLVLLQHAAEAEPKVMNPTTNVMFWTLVIFIVLLIVLGKFAYPPILGYAAAREKRIQDALDESRRQREEAERILEEQRQELARARSQAQEMIAEGKTAAEKIRADMLSQARTEQEALMERTRSDIARERDQMLESLRREAVDLALAAASKLLHQRVDAEADRKIVRDYLAQVSTAQSGR